MPFFGLFRNKQDKLVEAISWLYINVNLATFKTEGAVAAMLEEKLESTLEPSASYDLRCEFFCFYAHMLDYFSFAALGEHGRDIVTDYGIEEGIADLVNSSMSMASYEVKVAHAQDLLERFNVMTLEYTKSPSVFVSNFYQVLQQGGVPGVNDAFSDEPESKVSRLVQNVNETLTEHIPDLGTKSNFVRGTAEAFGTDSEGWALIALCATIQTSVHLALTEANLTERLGKMRRLIPDPPKGGRYSDGMGAEGQGEWMVRT